MALKIAPPDAKERTYWVGTTESCPIQHLTILGVCFPRFTTIRQKTKVNGEEIDRPAGRIMGGIVHMTAEKCEEIKTRISELVVRWQGEPSEFCAYGRRGDVLWSKEMRVREKEMLSTNGAVVRAEERAPSYRAQPQDYPLAGDKAHPAGYFLRLVTKPEDAAPFFMTDPTQDMAPVGAPTSSGDEKTVNELGKVVKKPVAPAAR